MKIGVFGLGAQLNGLVATENYGNIKYENPITAAQRVVSTLRGKERCDVVICLSHLGWKNGAYSDVELIKHTTGIDVVLGGHSHSYFEKPMFYQNADGKSVPLQQMGKNGAFVGRMVLKLHKK